MIICNYLIQQNSPFSREVVKPKTQISNIDIHAL